MGTKYVKLLCGSQKQFYFAPHFSVSSRYMINHTTFELHKIDINKDENTDNSYQCRCV